jgi:hypothetical protein
MNNKFNTICVAMALIAMPLTGQAIPVTYDITSGSAPGFSGSWLHAGTTQMGSTGFFANGDAAHITGSLTLDMSGSVTASGLLSGTGNLGLGIDTWTIDITGGSSGSYAFVGGEMDLLSLSYDLTSAGGHASSGTFYFAARDFNGGTADDGPNYIDNDKLFLWGNNWLNANGAGDRADFLAAGNPALGLDLYGVAAVPEPGMLALLTMGLAGFGVRRRK